MADTTRYETFVLQERARMAGETWELRGEFWHMVDEADYAPVSAENFPSYVECIEVGDRRRRMLENNIRRGDEWAR
jgi:hypothetical protein